MMRMNAFICKKKVEKNIGNFGVEKEIWGCDQEKRDLRRKLLRLRLVRRISAR
jgi:hypothetical protein